jgi:prephenate dehydrogenase
VNAARAEVIVVSCPICSYRDYIKTVRDFTTADNLLSLPRF